MPCLPRINDREAAKASRFFAAGQAEAQRLPPPGKDRGGCTAARDRNREAEADAFLRPVQPPRAAVRGWGSSSSGERRRDDGARSIRRTDPHAPLPHTRTGGPAVRVLLFVSRFSLLDRPRLIFSFLKRENGGRIPRRDPAVLSVSASSPGAASRVPPGPGWEAAGLPSTSPPARHAAAADASQNPGTERTPPNTAE